MTTENNTPQATGLLPAMAAIAIYMLFVAMIGGFGALNGRYPGGRYVVLCVCSLVVVGVFGFLKLKRWGWALITGAALSLCLWIIYMSKLMHNPGMLVMAAFNLCVFLYLVRPEVRERVR
jgi:hypothetical protein